MAKKPKRFTVIYKKGYTKIYVDNETGVHYLFITDGYGGGLTPLLDENGRPVIAKPTEEAEEDDAVPEED